MECNTGISGDMTVAALLDLGADVDKLRKALDSLEVDGFQVEISRVKKAGLDACDFHVRLDHEHENHDHDMEYLHGHEHHYGGHHHEEHDCHEHYHEGHGYDAHHHHQEHGHHEHDHHHEHGHHEHDHYGHDHHHEHRGMPEIKAVIERADITERAKRTALRIFEIIAKAESAAHGVPMEEVHFHEVGAVDSIVDVVAAAVCLDDLKITEVIVPKLVEGTGTVRCQHGIIPVPVPAVVNIAQKHHLKMHMTEVEGELVTPTGAAIVAAIRTSEHLPENFTIEKTGIGAGKRNYERPSLLRAMLIAPEQKEADDISASIYVLESNIDDCSGEALGYTMDCLLEAGARDAHYTPVFMKKNRPAYLLRVICDAEDIERMEEIIFRETTTIGIRRMKMERTVLKRENEKRATPFGEAEVKVCTLPDGKERYYPEYTSVIQLAQKEKIGYQDAYDIIKGACLKCRD